MKKSPSENNHSTGHPGHEAQSQRPDAAPGPRVHGGCACGGYERFPWPWGVPTNEWLLMENATKIWMRTGGYLFFRKLPICKHGLPLWCWTTTSHCQTFRAYWDVNPGTGFKVLMFAALRLMGLCRHHAILAHLQWSFTRLKKSSKDNHGRSVQGHHQWRILTLRWRIQKWPFDDPMVRLIGLVGSFILRISIRVCFCLGSLLIEPLFLVCWGCTPHVSWLCRSYFFLIIQPLFPKGIPTQYWYCMLCVGSMPWLNHLPVFVGQAPLILVGYKPCGKITWASRKPMVFCSGSDLHSLLLWKYLC